jgi:hypothetical protein
MAYKFLEDGVGVGLGGMSQRLCEFGGKIVGEKR